MNKRFCSNCGTQIRDGAKFCHICGKMSEENEQTTVLSKEDFQNDEGAQLNNVNNTVVNSDESDALDATTVLNAQSYPNPPVAANKPDDNSFTPVAQTYGQPIPVRTNVKQKKPSYVVEIIIFVLSVICLIASLTVFIVRKIDFKGIDSNSAQAVVDAVDKNEEIPELTVDMAADLLDSAWAFPYHFFDERGMLIKEDSILYPNYDDYEIHCYRAEGIDSKEDYFEFFTEYATEEFVRENFDKDFYYAISDSKIYFLPNEFMGHEGYGSSYLIVEKIDNLTYFIYDTFFGRENIIEFIDGKYKVSHIDPEFAMNRGNNIDDNYVKIPELSDLTLSEAEEKLNSVGLKLDRNNITYVNSNWCVEGQIVISKYKYRYVAPGAAVGVYVSSGGYNS